MGVTIDRSVSYIEAFNSLDWAFENKVKNFNEKDQIEFFKMFYQHIDKTINEILMVNKDADKESTIRKMCKYTVAKLLPFVNSRIEKYHKKMTTGELSSEEMLNLNEWLELEDNFYAIASMRSLYHFAMYMERDDADSDKVWSYIMDDVMGSIFYYANQMILNKTYHHLIKQCPTGYGKSKSDCVIISYILGYDQNAKILKVVGNKTLVRPITENIVKMIQSTRFGKVFKHLGKYKGKDDMFKNLQLSEGSFLLKDSKAATNFLCVNKETSIDGTRYDYQFYDDVTQSKDRENVTQHLKDRNNYTGQWKKRASSEYDVTCFYTGTAYHREDFLSYIKNFYANKMPLVVDLATQKYAWSKFVKLNNTKDCVYIMVQKLANLELGEDVCYCTFPQKFSKENALKMLHGSLGSKREFYAMEQQNPLPPETLCFDWVYLNTYRDLPNDILEKQSCESKCIIDPSRFGGDNFSCLIFEKSLEKEKEKFFLTDCYYEKVAAKKAVPEIAKKIVKHKVRQIYLENNIDITDTLERELAALQYFTYDLISFYTYEKKNEKIAKYRDDIKDKIIFPYEGMYHPESPMGRAMFDIISYSIDGKSKGHDDSIDCCAMFIENEQKGNENVMEVWDTSFRL